jgi:O-succinylbenzoic acid--CoA ligase
MSIKSTKKRRVKKNLKINQKDFDYSFIKSAHYISENDFEAQTLDFCHQWFSEFAEFNLTTSGSTGKPTFIQLTRSQMKASAEATVQFLNLGKDTQALICINTAYIGGKMMLVRGLEYDWDLYVISPSSNPFRLIQEQIQCSDDELLTHLKKLAFDFVALVPLQMEALLNDTLDFSEILNGMQSIILGGGTVSHSLTKKIQQLSVPVYHTYGMTETVSHIALRLLNGQNADEYFETLPKVKIKQDERGALTILSPTTEMQWIQTNDLVEIISENQFIWKGRADNVINSGGIKIHPEILEVKIEKVMQQMGWQNDFFLAGISDDKLGEQLILVIEGEWEESEKLALFKKILSKKVNKYEFPKKIVYLEQFIKTNTQKIQRKATLDLIEVIS